MSFRRRDLEPEQLAAIKMAEPDRRHTLLGRRRERDLRLNIVIDHTDDAPYQVEGYPERYRTLRLADSAARRLHPDNQ